MLILTSTFETSESHEFARGALYPRELFQHHGENTLFNHAVIYNIVISVSVKTNSRVSQYGRSGSHSTSHSGM